ncbi:unnamed protein product [Schistosoma turkestanicum]|nr:unnamed protein product [Schistosoma turkestanicum]
MSLPSKRIRLSEKGPKNHDSYEKNERFNSIASDISVLVHLVESVTDEDASEFVANVVAAGDVSQILKFLDTGKDRKPAELLAVFKALTIIILKTSRDLKDRYPNVARELSEGLLEDARFSLCLKSMRSQNAEILKACFQLLASVVTVSEDLARGILRYVDFESMIMKKCSKRRNLGDKCDVRTCFVNFLASFVYLDNNFVLRELVDKKGALDLLINGSFVDKYSNVILILCVLKKVAENSSISKTQRVRVFNQYCLQKLASLYIWRGEGNSIDEVLRKDITEVNEQELASIRDTVHKLLTHLFTSSRFGLVFSNKFDSNIQHNSLILACLTSAQMEDAYKDPLRTELVVVALCKCPELFPHYLDHLAPSLYPRNSPTWFCLMEFISHIYKSVSKYIIQFTVTALSHSLNVEVLAGVMANFCVLSPKMVDPIRKALQFNLGIRKVNSLRRYLALFQYYSNYPVVYQYLSKFIHLLYTRTSLTVSYKPKIFFKLLLKYVNLKAMLFTNVTFKHQSMDEKMSTISDEYLLKEYLFRFLLEIASVAPKFVYKHISVLWLLSAYNATMSSLDQTILQLIYLLEKYSPGSLIRSSYLVWGPTVCKHYEFDSQSNVFSYPTLLREPNVNTLFNVFDDNQLLESAYNFPLYRRWLNAPDSYVIDSKIVKIDRTHDPCFILHVLYYYLHCFSGECEQNNADVVKPVQFLKTFYLKNCLCYAVAGLSSYSKHMRNMARTIIGIYRKLLGLYISGDSTTSNNHDRSEKKPNLSSKHFPEGQQIAFVLDILRNSLSHGGGSVFGGGSRKAKSFHISMDSGGRLTKLHANFFIRVLKILSRPENHMFQPIWSCLLAKPAIDLRYVPEFLRLFFSTNNKFTVERQWICRLCVDSLSDPADYLVMENSLVFKHILCAYSLPSADMSFKLSVLRLLANATKHNRIVHSLIRFHAILLWLARYAATSTNSTEQTTLFLSILENIHNALGEKSSNQPILDIVNLIREECSVKKNNMDLYALSTIPPET